MTRAEIKSRIPVLQAWLEQQAIEYRLLSPNPPFATNLDWGHFKGPGRPDIFNPDTEWRIAPQAPKPREWWIVPTIIPLQSPPDKAFLSENLANKEIIGSTDPWRLAVHVVEVVNFPGTDHEILRVREVFSPELDEQENIGPVVNPCEPTSSFLDRIEQASKKDDCISPGPSPDASPPH